MNVFLDELGIQQFQLLFCEGDLAAAAAGCSIPSSSPSTFASVLGSLFQGFLSEFLFLRMEQCAVEERIEFEIDWRLAFTFFIIIVITPTDINSTSSPHHGIQWNRLGCSCAWSLVSMKAKDVVGNGLSSWWQGNGEVGQGHGNEEKEVRGRKR